MKFIGNARALTRNREFTNWKDLKSYLIDLYGNCQSASEFSTRIENCYVKLIGCLDLNLTREARQTNLQLLRDEALNVLKNLQLLVKCHLLRKQ